MDGWDYSKVLKKAKGSDPKDRWVVWVKAPIGSPYQEISCVHTSEPHGLLSYGWDGPHKIILHDCNEEQSCIKKNYRVLIQEGIVRVATVMCLELNEQFPLGIGVRKKSK